MKIKKLEFSCQEYRETEYRLRSISFIAGHVEITLNQYTINAWVEGMNNSEQKCFYKILNRQMRKKHHKLDKT